MTSSSIHFEDLISETEEIVVTEKLSNVKCCNGKRDITTNQLPLNFIATTNQKSEIKICYCFDSNFAKSICSGIVLNLK